MWYLTYLQMRLDLAESTERELRYLLHRHAILLDNCFLSFSLQIHLDLSYCTCRYNLALVTILHDSTFISFSCSEFLNDVYLFYFQISLDFCYLTSMFSSLHFLMTSVILLAFLLNFRFLTQSFYLNFVILLAVYNGL